MLSAVLKCHQQCYLYSFWKTDLITLPNFLTFFSMFPKHQTLQVDFFLYIALAYHKTSALTLFSRTATLAVRALPAIYCFRLICDRFDLRLLTIIRTFWGAVMLPCSVFAQPIKFITGFIINHLTRYQYALYIYRWVYLLHHPLFTACFFGST